MDGAIRREKKAYALRPTKRPQTGYPLAGVVIVRSQKNGFCYVGFSEELVTDVGKAMPYGLGPHAQAYLKVTIFRGLWRVYAYYFGGRRGTLLWETDKEPSWLSKPRRKKDVSNRSRSANPDGAEPATGPETVTRGDSGSAGEEGR